MHGVIDISIYAWPIGLVSVARVGCSDGLKGWLGQMGQHCPSGITALRHEGRTHDSARHDGSPSTHLQWVQGSGLQLNTPLVLNTLPVGLQFPGGHTGQHCPSTLT